MAHQLRYSFSCLVTCAGMKVVSLKKKSFMFTANACTCWPHIIITSHTSHMTPPGENKSAMVAPDRRYLPEWNLLKC